MGTKNKARWGKMQSSLHLSLGQFNYLWLFPRKKGMYSAVSVFFFVGKEKVWGKSVNGPKKVIEFRTPDRECHSLQAQGARVAKRQIILLKWCGQRKCFTKACPFLPIKCHFLTTKCDFRVDQSYLFLHERRGKSKQCQTMAFWHPYSRLILFLPCLVFCGPLTKENEKPCLQLLQESRQRNKDFFLPSNI